LEDSVEGEVLVSLGFSITSDVLELEVVEGSLSSPVGLAGPHLTTEPVADEVQITRVNKDGEVLAQKVSNVGTFVSEPIRGQGLVNSVIAFRPAVALDSESFNDILLGKEIIDVAEVVAEGSVAGELDVVDVELGGVSGDLSETFLAFDESDFPRSVEDEVLASSEDQLKGIVVDLTNKAVFEGVNGVLGILPVGGNESITDSRTLEVKVGVSLLEDVSGDGRDVMSSVRFTSNVERSAVELGISGKEFSQEEVHILSDFSFVGDVSGGVGETSTKRLVNVEKVSLVVP